MYLKKVFILLLIIPIILLSIPGCTSSQEDGSTQPQGGSEPSPPVGGKLFMAKAPALEETAELTFSFYSYVSPEEFQARIEFERYDPALYYPLGRGRVREGKLKGLAKNLDSTDPYHLYWMEAAAEEPEISVPQKEVLVSGDLNWEGFLSKERRKIELTAVVRFPEEGEWLIKGWLEGEERTGYTYDRMYLTIGKDSGKFGWPKDYPNAGQWTPPDNEHPMSITIKPSRAPLLGERFRITMSIKSIEDLAQAEGSLEFFKMEGITKETVPLRDILVDGNLEWQGSLEKDIPIEINGTVVFPEEGDWGVLEWHRSSPENISVNRHGIFLHIGKEKSRFGWPESHERRIEDQDIPSAPAPIRGDGG